RRVLSTSSLEGDASAGALTVPDDEMTQPEIWLDWLERRQELEQALQRLTEPHREKLICIYFEQLSYPEAATLLDITLGTVRSRVHRVLNILQSVLSAEGKKRYESA